MNTPVSLGLAKLLKEKGYDKPTVLHRDLEGKLPFNYEECFIKRNWNQNPYLFSAPTIAEVVIWLYEKYRVWISVDMVFEIHQTGFWYCIRQSKEDDIAIQSEEYKTPTEAYLAAIEYTLNNLI